jgi:hypothetical protein
MELLCTYGCKWKSESCESNPGMGEGIKENNGGGVFNCDVLYIGTCKMYPLTIIIEKKVRKLLWVWECGSNGRAPRIKT